MKKLICVILCSIMLVSVPFRGYASSAVFFGMSEELVLGYLASLLGIQAKETITSYNDLLDYNNDLRYGFTEYLAGSATSMELAEWIGQAVIGNINTDSIIWEKFYSYCINQYNPVSEGIITVPSYNPLNLISYDFIETNSASWANRGNTVQTWTGMNYISSYYYSENNVTYYKTIGASDIRSGDCITPYTYDNKTVYYGIFDVIDRSGTITVIPQAINDKTLALQNTSDAQKVAWTMVYGGYLPTSSGSGIISGSLDNVISTSVKDGIIDGTSVLQLYNPAKSQNGLHIVPDPDDPDEIVIPAMLTADWYNFLQQFGSGPQSFVRAYNALNAIEGVSTGAINGLYNNLGIASAVNSAADAAQGTLSLTDNNVFPQLSTVADAVTGVIPGALTPVAPDSGITNDSDQGLYKLPDLRDFFPFCIPFDFIDLLSCFVAEPETPEFVIALSDGSHLADQEISLESFDNIASIVRTLELAIFILGLMLITRNLIRG